MATQLLLWKRERGAKIPLERLASDSSRDTPKLHALVALDGLGLLRETTVLTVLKDTSPTVRRHAVRLAESFLKSSPRVAETLPTLAGDADSRVRLQVAATLSGWADPRATNALGKLLAN